MRLGVLGVAVVVLFMLLVLRLWALQVLNTRTFVAQAASNHEKQVVVRAPRGEILDRKGRVLVRNRVAYELDLDPGAVRDSAQRHRLLLRVANMLDLEPRPLWERVDRQLRMDPVAPVTLARDIDVKLKWYLQENPEIFRGLSVAQVPLRYYPYRTLGAHIYGQLSEIGPKQLKDPRFHDYHRGDVIGQSGVERRYDAFLRGIDGIDAVTVDAFGQPTGAVRHLKAPVPGRNVRLTIDLDTQRAAEQALAYGVRSNASEGANAGAFVALDPKNGEVRALASFPTFDPNWFISYRKPKFQAQLKRITRDGGEPAHYPLLDRAIAGRYPAASTFKPFVGIAAVKERLVTPSQLLRCTPSRLLLRQALQQLGQLVRRAHRPHRRARALLRHVLLPASATRSSARAASRVIRCRTGRRSSASAAGPASTSWARTRACCRRPPGRRTSTSRTSPTRASRPTTPTGCSTRAGTRPTRSTSRSGRATSTSRRCSSRSAMPRSRTAAPS